MNRLTESSIITEMNYKENFAYLLDSAKSFVPTEYKVLTAQGEDGFVPCMCAAYNGKMQLFYLAQNLKKLSEVFFSIDQKRLGQLICQLFKAFLNVKNNGFLKCENIDIDFNKVFVDTDKLQIKLTYIPLNKSAFDSEGEAENALRAKVCKYIDSLNERTPEIIYIRGQCANGNQSLENVVSVIAHKTSPNDAEEKPKSELKPGSEKEKKEAPKTCVLTNAKMSIIVNRPEFTIGKQIGKANYVITQNNTVSRVHCKIVKTKTGYAVIDLNSSNGTFLNGKRLQPNVPSAMKSGDTLRLSNIDFNVVI